MKRLTPYGLQSVDIFKCELCGFSSASDGRIVSHLQIEHDLDHSVAVYYVLAENTENVMNTPESNGSNQWYFRRKREKEKTQRHFKRGGK